MAYVNILSVPGLTYKVWSHGYGTPWVEEASPGDVLSAGGGVFTINASGGDITGVRIEITNFAGAVLPCTARSTAIELAATGSVIYGYGFESSMGSESPVSGSVVRAVDVATRFFETYIGYPDIYLTGGQLKVELDATFPVPDFWTDFDGTYEDTELHKQVQLVSHPAVAAVAAVPPLEVCTPDPPDVPGPGGGLGGSGLGGGESSPPGYDNPPPPGEPRIRCFNVGNGITCCRDQNGNPVGSGCD